MIREAISRVVDKRDLSQQEAVEVMKEIMSGQAAEAQIASFITALRMKGETAGEITGFAATMREFALKIKLPAGVCAVDTCGTGGDVKGTFNVSTATVFVAAGAGHTVAKHGNRSVSSSCGSADVMEALGVDLDMPQERIEECLEKTGVAFLFAPKMHPAMKYAIGPRKQIGIRTVFNMLGPLTNPAGVKCQVMGVYSAGLVPTAASVLKNLGTDHSFVVHGSGLDEFTLTGPTLVAEIKAGKIRKYTVTPRDFGMKRCTLDELKGGDVRRNIEILYGILKGEKGCRRDIVLLNSAAAICAAGGAAGLKEGVRAAAGSIDSGRALAKLEKFRDFAAKKNP